MILSKRKIEKCAFSIILCSLKSKQDCQFLLHFYLNKQVMNLISKAAIVCSWTRTTRSKVKTVRTLIAIENVGIPWKRRRTREVALKTYAYPGGRLENARIPGRSPWKRTHIWAWIRRYDSPYDFKRSQARSKEATPRLHATGQNIKWRVK